MNIQQLVPASHLARNLGVKMMVYGDPGVGKTPVLNTAPRPVLCACEPGLRSMANSSIPTWEAYTLQRMSEFFDWLFGSHEARAFDTVGVDSVSQYAEIALAHAMHSSRNRDPRSWYGDMSKEVFDKMSGLYFLQQKHVYLIAKKQQMEEGTANRLRARPYFPGKELHVKVPHLYDEILHMEKTLWVQDGKYYPVFRTQPNDAVLARDRSGKLAELEGADLSALISKAMQV